VRAASRLLPIGVALCGVGVVLGAIGFLWALFFSVGARGGTTSELIAYNLAHPLTAAIAYGPAALAVAIFAGGVVCLSAGVLRRRAERACS
jgi:hypothetical protein